MSFYSDASLVMIPSGYKTSKVYCAVPTDGAADLSFSRSNDTATRVGPDGLIEKVRTNLITYSQDFGNAAWVTNNSTKTTSQTDPNSGTTAVKIVSTANVNSGIYQNKTASSTTRTASLWMKGEVGGEVVEYGDATNRATATLTTSWVRYSFAATDASAFFVIYNETASPLVQTWYVAFVQYENSDIATDYIATTTAAVSVGPVANVPRLDYLGSSCPRLLLEPQRTNLITYSEQFDNGVYTKTDVAITANSIASPDGYTNADLFTTNNAAGTIYRVYHGSTGGTDATNTISAFFKYGNHPYVYIVGDNVGVGKFGIFNIQNGTIENTSAGFTSTITNYGNGWYRCTLTGTMDSVNNIQFGLTGSTTNYVGTSLANGKTMYCWGAQREYNVSYATSYIPTLGAAVTRGADIAEKTGISSLIGQTSGSVFFEFTVNSITQIGDPVLWYMKDGGSGQRYVELYSNSNLVYAEIDGGGLIAQITKTGLTVGRHKCAIAYAPNDMTFYVDGVQVGTDTSGTPNGFSTFGLQYYLSQYTGQQMVNQALVFKTRLSNSSLAELTSL
jgi:hypothetical protein